VQHSKLIGRQRQRRGWRVRNHLKSVANRPRLCVFRSHKHIYAQLIDDAAEKTLVSASTKDKELAGQIKYGGNKVAAQIIGKALAERALAAGHKDVYFDRREYDYHGRVAALAEAAREAGLNF
jgi:large subunit ribosomal protein L18